MRSISKIDKDIAIMRDLIRRYPTSPEYKRSLQALRTERDLAAQQIGRK